MTDTQDATRLRQLADEFGCYTDHDIETLTGWSEGTRRSYRQRRKLEFIRAGQNYLYPKDAVRALLEARRRTSRTTKEPAL
jgi:hypothetical protein